MDGLQGSTGAAGNLGKYRLIAVLGRGGMACVHLAVMHGPSGFNKLVVLKQIHPEYAEDPEVLGMFLDEARLAARLSHPNVVQTNEVGQDGERHFMAMEYLDGQPLNRILHRLSTRGGLPLAMHLQIIVDLLGGLHHAHELADYDGSPLGVVHRDINPQNIFVTYDGVVKVVDFGVAKARSSVVQTGFGIVKGKISYMAPEQVRSEPVDRRADLFAVGVMLWEAVTHTRPWKGVTELAVMKSLIHGEFPPVRAAAPDVPEVLAAIITKALAPNREDRYATAAELQASLEAYLEATGERVQAREVSKLVSSLFAADRVALKAVVQAQLRADSTAALLPTIPTIEPATTPEVCLHSSGTDPPPRREPLASDANGRPTGSSAFATTMPEAPVAEPRARRGAGLRVGALALAAASAVMGLWAHVGPPMAPAGAAQAAQETAVVRIASKPSSKVELRLEATPAEARLFLDDRLLAGNPVSDSVPRDQTAHRLRIEAPGFVPRIESVSLDTDLSVSVALAAEPRDLEARATMSSSRPLGKRRKLDAKNPYADR